MSNFENATLISRDLPKSTQSFEEMFDEIVDNDSKIDMASINSRYFDLSPIFNHESDNKTPIDKQSHTSITKVTQYAEMLDSELKDGIELNDSNLSLGYYQSQINLENENLGRYSSTQETLCTECRFGTNSFFTSINTSQRPTQGSCLNHTAQIRDKDLSSERGSSQKRSLLVTPERKNSDIDMGKTFSLQNCSKKFKSEGYISTVKNSGINICKIIKPTISTPRILRQNSCAISQKTESFVKVSRDTISAEAEHSNHLLKHIDQLVEPFFKLSDHGRVLPNDSILCQDQSQKLEHAKSIENNLVTSMLQHVEKISIDENISTTNGTNRISLNEIIQSQSQDLDEINSNCSYSTLSQSTIEEIYCIEATEEIDHSKTIKISKEMPGTHSLKRINLSCSQNTIDEVYRTDVANDFGCSTIAKDSQYHTAEKIFAPSIISNEVIKDPETTDKAVIDFSLQPLIHKLPNKTNMREKNPVNLCYEKNLGRKCEIINRKAEDNLKSQCLNETQLKKMKMQDEIIKKNIISGSMIDNPVEGTDFRNDGISNIPDDSFLEISIDSLSDLEKIVKRGLNVEKEKTELVHVQMNDIKMNFTNSKNMSKRKKGIMDIPINLTLENTSSCSVENFVPLKNVSAKNVETKIAPNDFDTQFLTDTKLNNIGMYTETLKKKIKSVNSSTNCGANRTSIKIPKNPSKNLLCPQDDLSLEFLSESELQKIEEDAYMKAKQRSTLNLKNVNAKSDINGDVFYKPEISNMITEKKNDDLILPNWVTNPAPEPNYEKIKRAVDMKREYIKKMLQEILRLSTIVSKIQSIVYAKPHGGSETASKSSLQIQEPGPIHHAENNPNNRLPQSGTSSDMEFNTNLHSNTLATNFKDNDVFYVPQSSKPKYNVPSNIVVASVNKPAIKTDDIREDSGKREQFYESQLSRSKYDAPVIFNRSNDTGFNRGNLSNSYMQSNASCVFGSLKQDFNVNPRTREWDDSNHWNSGRENETGFRNIKSDTHIISKNKENFAKRMTTEFQLSQIKFNSTVFTENKTVLNKNRIESIGNNTNFYLPDKLSASNNHTILPSVRNNQILSSANVSKRPTADTKLDGQKSLNFGKNLVPHKTKYDNNIFYTGNK